MEKHDNLIFHCYNMLPGLFRPLTVQSGDISGRFCQRWVPSHLIQLIEVSCTTRRCRSFLSEKSKGRQDGVRWFSVSGFIVLQSGVTMIGHEQYVKRKRQVEKITLCLVIPTDLTTKQFNEFCKITNYSTNKIMESIQMVNVLLEQKNLISNCVLKINL